MAPSAELTHAPVEARVPEIVAPALALRRRDHPDFKRPRGRGAVAARRDRRRRDPHPRRRPLPQNQVPEVVVPRTLTSLADLPRDATGRFQVRTSARAEGRARPRGRRRPGPRGRRRRRSHGLRGPDAGCCRGPCGGRRPQPLQARGRTACAAPRGRPGLHPRSTATPCGPSARTTRAPTWSGHGARDPRARPTLPRPIQAVQGAAWVARPHAHAVREASIRVVDEIAALSPPSASRTTAGSTPCARRPCCCARPPSCSSSTAASACPTTSTPASTSSSPASSAAWNAYAVN